MCFQDLNLSDEYRNLSQDIIEEFFIPVLSNSIIYQRAVGFFSSSALIELSKGITHLVKNGGKIQVVASPRLSEEDIAAINMGLILKEELIFNKLQSELFEPKNIYEEKRLNFICNLIAYGVLEIKIAIMKSQNNICMYHEKMGLMMDTDNNIIAFTGSMNETSTAFLHNYETIEVYKSWTHDKQRVLNKKKAFELIWNDSDPAIEVISFENVKEELFKKYKKNDEIDLTIDLPSQPKLNPPVIKGPKIPQNISLYDYQCNAIESWAEQNFNGIFDMATGTGKTITSLAASVKLFEKLNGKLAIIIVCPLQHLVEQWTKEATMFNMKPIVGYSKSSQKNWLDRLQNVTRLFNNGEYNHFCFITTNSTFSTEKVQKIISRLHNKTLLIVDEAHNFGSKNLSRLLPSNIEYRLALSATINRKNDELGTSKLLSYFGEKCIEYTLEDAINQKKLTPYYYYPIPVSLTEDEREKYIDITKKIIKCCSFDRNGNIEITESAKILLIQRARIIAGAQNKLNVLKKLMREHVHDTHMLVYCGSTCMTEDLENSRVNEDEKRQIDIVTNLLGNELGIKVAQYTSREDVKTRQALKESLANGDRLQALVAIKCLDEGVDIPSIKKAFILASSTNPKEYIQRRGRVLRKFPGKKHSEIFDFVTIPYELDTHDISLDQLKIYNSLIQNEMDRITEFSKISLNPSDSFLLMNQLIDTYKKIIDWSKKDE